MSESPADQLRALPKADRDQFIASLSDAEAEALMTEWRGFLARPEQVAPPGDWSTWVINAGRGFGKTEAGAQWVRERVEQGSRHIALIAETQKDLEEVMVARLLAIYPEAQRPSVRFKPVRLTWPNGAVALGYNGTEPDQLRGPEFDAAWVDELAKYKRARQTWDMLQFTMRAGDDPRVIVTTTPRPIPVLREILASPRSVVTRGSTFDNAANLPAQFLADLQTRYGGTRLGRQELNAEMLDDLPGALWTREMFDTHRLREAPEMRRIVVAVDPSGTGGTEDDGDSIGIVVAGKGVDGRGYVLSDQTCKLSPDGWGRRAVAAYKGAWSSDPERFKADRIVAERNFGGAMVEHVIRTVDRKVSYKEVTASRGKVARAEPVAALYEQGRISHVGGLPDLEDQCCLIGPDGYIGEGSPDRADALVWALTEVMLGDSTFNLAGMAS